MKMTYGFSLVEMVVAMLIGSMISLLLFQSLGQFSKAAQSVDHIATIQTDKALLDRQWDRDFSGMFAPLKKTASTNQEGKDKEQTQAPKPPALTAAEQQKNQKEEEKYHADPFTYTVDQHGMVTMISCITSNPALMYGNLLPRMVRVVYQLVPDAYEQGYFMMKRQQSDDLELASFTKKDSSIRAYQLVSNIKKVTLEAWVEKIPKQQPAQSSQASPGQAKDTKKEKKEEQKRSYILWQEWKNMNDEEKKKYEMVLLPTFIKIVVTFIEKIKNGTRESEQTCWYAPQYDIQPVIIEGPSLLPTDKQRDGQKQATQQYRKINDDLQDFHDRVLSKKPGLDL